MTPSRRMLWLLLATICGPLITAIVGWPATIGSVPLVLLAIALFLDRRYGCSHRLSLERSLSASLSAGTPNPVILRLRNGGQRALALSVADGFPEEGRVDGPLMHAVTVAAGSRVSLSYAYTPLQRGRFVFRDPVVQFTSRLGLWQVSDVLPASEEVRVYPDIAAISRFEMLARRNQLSEFGAAVTRMTGDGHEFERMRDYRNGDEPRRVDWKTTARLGRLIVREMGQDRNQNLLFLLDMGRRMRQTTDGLSHFDYALNTAIILGHIARKNGDNVGAVLFSDRVCREVPLRRGAGAVEGLLQATFDLQPEPVATDYAAAVTHVLSHCRKRTLVLMMTHMGGEMEQRELQRGMRFLSRRHLPLCLFFREPQLDRTLDREVRDTGDMFSGAVAADLLLERQDGIERLRRSGILALDTLPGEISALAVHHYLDIKARHLL